MPRATAQQRAELRHVKEQLRLLDAKDAARDDPKALINEIRYYDPVAQAPFEFKMYPPEGWESPLEHLYNGDLVFDSEGAFDWYWQSQIIDWLHHPDMLAYLIYKARQLGITLLCCAYALWLMLFRPGAVCVGYSYEEGEAQKLVQACWEMFKGLPDVMKSHVTVMTPMRNMIPSEYIRLRHEDGRISSFQALPATGPHGHGARVTFGIMDEVAKQPASRKVYEAIIPATISRGGKLALVSTADGVSNLETGEGNFFHHLWATRKEKGLRYVFLPWNAEPTRDEEWYEKVAMKLPEVERNRQYPLNERDGFVLSGAVYFDSDALKYYGDEPARPLFSGQFVKLGRLKSRFTKLRDGIIDIYALPKQDGRYIISADTATGRGQDYTSVDVIDLTTAQIVAQMHAKIESPRAAFQLHFLGKWYNTAMIGVERGGGYGEAVITALRDGNNQLPAYPILFRHASLTKSSRPMSEDYGFPMSPKNRPLVLEKLKVWLHDRIIPNLPAGTLDELQSFVYKDTIPSPRAQDGCNDDRVMSLALGVFMYERYGETPYGARRNRKRTANKYRPGPVKAGG